MMIENTNLILDLLAKTSKLSEKQIKEVYKDNLIDDKWIIVDPDIYNKYKNNIKITYIADIKEELKDNYFDYRIKDVIAYMDTKEYYINMKYNINFIAFSISEREYECATNPLVLICFNRFLIKNFDEKNNTPPKLSEVLRTLRWKITRKALAKIKQDYKIF